MIVVEDENGNIVRETMKDTDTLARYKTMHETLVYLSHLDHDDTENQMLSKLHLQASFSAAYVSRLSRVSKPSTDIVHFFATFAPSHSGNIRVLLQSCTACNGCAFPAARFPDSIFFDEAFSGSIR